MASDDLETFRNQWKAELQGVQQNDTNQLKKSNVQNLSPSSSGSQTLKRCAECSVHPAFRDNSNCHTCLFVNKESKGNEGTASKFYPFRIVDDLLCSQNDTDTTDHDSKTNIPDVENTKKNKKRKGDILADEWMFTNKKASLKDPNERNERYLDLFIADLDEINEIPFFDLTVPREVAIKIFEPLDMVDLCRCSQVSKSWRSLADDELLWCKICHDLGYEVDTTTVEKNKWKAVVKYYVERERKLSYNWKNRLGSYTQFQHIPGGILCAVDSSGDFVAAGYTNGDVKLWSTEDQYDIVFQPSNTSLVINEQMEGGTISNNVTTIAVSDDFVVAGYRQGNVDIWQTEGKTCTSTVHVINCQDSRGVVKVGVAKHSDLVYAVTGPRDQGVVHVCQDFKSGEGFLKSKTINIPSHIYGSQILEDNNKAHLVIATQFKVDLYTTETTHQEADMFNHMTNIHNVLGSPVTCIDVRSSPCQLAVGLGSYGGSLDPYRVKVYDAISGKLLSTMMNHTWTITCINIADSPDNLLVTGSGDRRVRVFDLRTETMTHLFSGHSSQVNTVQMDEVKVISGGDDGFVRVWDLRMAKKLWDIHNRHPVKLCHFSKDKLIVGNVPTNNMPVVDEFESVTHRRYRGSIQMYNFSVDQTTQGVPEICHSTYDEPLASHYNISLKVPYDNL